MWGKLAMSTTIYKLLRMASSCSSEKMPRILSFESPTSGQRKPPSAAAAATTSSCEGYRSSPYPLVDRFITSCVNKGGVQGAIRRWSYFQQGTTILYTFRSKCKSLLINIKFFNGVLREVSGIWYQAQQMVWKYSESSQEQQHHVSLLTDHRTAYVYM